MGLQGVLKGMDGMDQDAGYIKIYRKFFGNFLWAEKRSYSRAEAWIDLLASARYEREPETIMIAGSRFICNRGEVLRSLREWAARWRWSASKVKRFFDLMETEEMVVNVDEGQTSRTLIINYDQYNPVKNECEKIDTASGTPTKQQAEHVSSCNKGNSDSKRNTDETASGTATKHGRNTDEAPCPKERKNINNNPCSPLPGTVVLPKAKKRKLAKLAAIPDGLRSRKFYRAWLSWQKDRKERKKPMTAKAAAGQLKTLSEHDPETAVAMLQQSIDNGWTGIFDLKTARRSAVAASSGKYDQAF